MSPFWRSEVERGRPLEEVAAHGREAALGPLCGCEQHFIPAHVRGAYVLLR